MRFIQGLIVFVLLFCMCSGPTETSASYNLLGSFQVKDEYPLPIVDSSWIVFDDSRYNPDFLYGLKEHSTHYNIKVYRDYFLLNNDTIWPPQDLVLDSFYTLMATYANKTLKVELRRRNNTDVVYHLALLENMDTTLFSVYGIATLHPSFYLAAEAEEDEEGIGYLCTPYTEQDVAECITICIGRNDEGRLIVMTEGHCQLYADLKHFSLPVEVPKEEFYKRIVIVKDSAEYSQEFLNGWKRSHTIDEIVEMRRGYLLVASKDTLAFPEQIDRGKRYIYEAIENDTILQLVLIRKNTTTLNYQISLTSKGKQLWGEQGEVHFDPSHLMTAIDGECWNYLKSLEGNYRETCNLRICIAGINNEKHAQFKHLDCGDKDVSYFFTLKKIE
jgi:hypothetical protein